MTSIPKQELEYHYTPSRWSHRMGPQQVLESHVKVTSDGTSEAKRCLEVKAGISYGSTDKQKLDVYSRKNSAGKKGSPIFVYIHGGYWQEKVVNRENAGFLAQPLAAAGATVIPIGYELCPDVSLDEIVSEVKKAVCFIIELAKKRQASGVYLCGHSAGAHLAAMMLTDCQDDGELIKGAVLVSGVYDLRPLVKTSVNDALKLTEGDAWRLSPGNVVKDIASRSVDRDILIAVGEHDSPEFHRQSTELEEVC
ncbi:hypothetical protein V1264_006525 [Littorina saxatilis]|uniref:Alpha/beta hydrolase fold-3 domain-containing protein n=1 Tax=Littorina saxatilis TaxID=31220 RepID=A0AAN9AZK8_9CAEN